MKLLSVLILLFSVSLMSCQNTPDMVAISGGMFVMGANDGEGDEKPEHEVVIDDFFIRKFEVSVAKYTEFCDATGRDMPAAPEWGLIDDHPIINTSWNDAMAYITWLNNETNENYRLPTEAEFEYVARNGGKPGVYPWGDGQPTNENIADLSLTLETGKDGVWSEYIDGYPITAPVGSFAPNKLGVCDINGNVWEWCTNWYAPYPVDKVINPKGPENGTHKVGRGASYNADPWHCRSAGRSWVEPTFSRPGFRLVKDKS